MKKIFFNRQICQSLLFSCMIFTVNEISATTPPATGATKPATANATNSPPSTAKPATANATKSPASATKPAAASATKPPVSSTSKPAAASATKPAVTPSASTSPATNVTKPTTANSTTSPATSATKPTTANSTTSPATNATNVAASATPSTSATKPAAAPSATAAATSPATNATNVAASATTPLATSATNAALSATTPVAASTPQEKSNTSDKKFIVTIDIAQKALEDSTAFVPKLLINKKNTALCFSGQKGNELPGYIQPGVTASEPAFSCVSYNSQTKQNQTTSDPTQISSMVSTVAIEWKLAKNVQPDNIWHVHDKTGVCGISDHEGNVTSIGSVNLSDATPQCNLSSGPISLSSANVVVLLD